MERIAERSAGAFVAAGPYYRTKLCLSCHVGPPTERVSRVKNGADTPVCVFPP